MTPDRSGGEADRFVAFEPSHEASSLTATSRYASRAPPDAGGHYDPHSACHRRTKDSPDRLSTCVRARPAAASADHARRCPHRRSLRGGRGLPENRRTPHVLRHTLCTPLADAGADADVGTIRELAGHADIRTTTIYTAVSDGRLEQAIAERTRQRNRLRRAATADGLALARRPSVASANSPARPLPTHLRATCEAQASRQRREIQARQPGYDALERGSGARTPAPRPTAG